MALLHRRASLRLLPVLLVALAPGTVLLTPGAGKAQSAPVITWGGEIRPRMEARDPGETFFTSMRTRLSLDVALDPGLRFFLQPQDVRTWGEEESERDRSADAVDFHQAFLEVDDLPGVGGRLRAGRQEVAIAEARFLAAPNWGQAGQTFDGIRWMRGIGEGRLDLTYLAIREGASTSHEGDGDFWAAWYAHPTGSGGSLDLLGFFDRDATALDTRQLTAGGVWKGSLNPLFLRMQVMGQSGEREGLDVSAYMVAGELRLAFMEERASVSLWYDHLSGDDDPDDGEVASFSTLYGARNRYYGRADHFKNIPLQTGGLGLRDAAIKLSLSSGELLSVNLDLHAFRTQERGGFDSQRLGEEADLWTRYRYGEHLTLQAGYSFTVAGPVMKGLETLSRDGHFGYFMTSLAF